MKNFAALFVASALFAGLFLLGVSFCYVAILPINGRYKVHDHQKHLSKFIKFLENSLNFHFHPVKPCILL